MPADETQFVAVDIADSGQHSLIQQRRGDGAVRLCRQIVGGNLRIPVVAQQIGPQVVNRVAVMGAFEDLQHAQVDADRADIAGFQDDPDPVVGTAYPRRHSPAAVHLQMRVDTCRSDANEQMLAPAAHLIDHVTAEVDCREAWHPDIAARQRAADQRLAQCVCGAENGVTLGHALPQTQSAWRPGEPGVG